VKKSLLKFKTKNNNLARILHIFKEGRGREGNNVDTLPLFIQILPQIIRGCIRKFRDKFHRPPTDGSTWMSALCLGAGNVATQYAEWRRCVNIGSCTTRVFVTTCAVTFAISAWTWNCSRQQTLNSAWNSANLEGRLFKWDDVRMGMRPWVEDEAAAKGLPLWQSGGDPAGIAECSWHDSRTGLPARVPAVATALRSMCRCTGGLFWRGCCPNLNQVNTF